MKKIKCSPFIIIITICAVFFACTKIDEKEPTTFKKYINPKVGKYIIYQLDSLVTKSFGSSFSKISYLVKDSVVAVLMDNQNRESFKIFRYHYDSSTRRWNSTNTFLITPTPTGLEYVENNFRYVKMANPIKEDKTWLGNSFLSQSPYYTNALFTGWNYFYKDVDQPKRIGNTTYPNTITVVQYDSVENTTFNPKNPYNTFDKGYEIYADSIGLIYKDVLSWEYNAFFSYAGCKLIRPKAGGAAGFDTSIVNCNLASTNCDSLKRIPNFRILCTDTIIDRFFYNGYGVKQSIISHN
jgi:hypothetical protein